MHVKYLQVVHEPFQKCTSKLYRICTDFSIVHVKIFSFNFIVADISITRIRSSSSRNMDDDVKHIFEGLMSTDGPGAINLVVQSDPNPTKHVIKHILRNGTGVIRKKRAEGDSRSKNAARIREKR